MDKLNSIIKVVKSKALSSGECYKIEGLLLVNIKPSEIAMLLNRSLKTIKREIRRGTVYIRDSSFFTSGLLFVR